MLDQLRYWQGVKARQSTNNTPFDQSQGERTVREFYSLKLMSTYYCHWFWLSSLLSDLLNDCPLTVETIVDEQSNDLRS